MNIDKVKGNGTGKVKTFLTAEGAEVSAEKVNREGIRKVNGVFTTEDTEGTEEVKGEVICRGLDG
jgi:hypothetical protein